MSPKDIKVGNTYRAKRGGKLRKIVGEGGLAYPGQINTDTVKYEEPGSISERPKSMTRVSFATWAKEQVS